MRGEPGGIALAGVVSFLRALVIALVVTFAAGVGDTLGGTRVGFLFALAAAVAIGLVLQRENERGR